MARDSGAKQVYFASAAPPIRYPNVYGIDMPSAKELVAHDRSVLEIQEHIGADWLIYQDIDDLIESSREGNSLVDGFELSVFDGIYQTGLIDESYLSHLRDARGDTAVDRAEGALVGLHNRA